MAEHPKYRLELFGGARLEGRDGPLAGPSTQRRRLALLSLLAVSPGGMSRDRIVGMLWPESGEDRARHALAQLLYALRKDLGSNAILGSAAVLRLNTAVVASDVAELETALGCGDHERVADLHSGPLLDSFYLGGCVEFERWIDRERMRLAHLTQSSIEQMALRATSAGNPVVAVRWYRRLVSVTPFDARVTLDLMGALARAGDRAGAIGVAREHGIRYRSELAAEPDPAIAALATMLSSPTDATRSVVALTDTQRVADGPRRAIERGGATRRRACRASMRGRLRTSAARRRLVATRPADVAR